MATSRLRRFTPTHVGNTYSRPLAETAGTVHPHARGEYAQLDGSSGCRRSVHPHARGEYAVAHVELATDAGSPPRTWGIRARRHRPDVVTGSPPRTWGIRRRARSRRGTRFTPTHVGNTGCRPQRDRRLYGSPPRTWGILQRTHAKSDTSRFTPTHVGNTTHAHVIRLLHSSVHPHARGEYAREGRLRIDDGTVHPHARGEYKRFAIRDAARVRFTPTHVGNTQRERLQPVRCTVHPHARGEYAGSFQRRASGSPPRTWGIPTQALRIGPGASVHPHARGEYAANWRLTRGGSPPRTWGIRDRRPNVWAKYGSPPRTWGIPRLSVNVAARPGSPPRTWGILPGLPLRRCDTVHPHARGEYVRRIR